jgi:hypothetical protein
MAQLAYSPATISTNPANSPFSIYQLATAIGGELHLADLPPVDGATTLSGRIVFTPAAIQPGVIFWDLSAPFSRYLHRPEEIFLGGHPASSVLAGLNHGQEGSPFMFWITTGP